MASNDPGPGFQLGDVGIPSTLGPLGVGAPAVRASDLLGSHRTVDTLGERDAIAPTYRDEGMSVWVTTTAELYRLVGGTTNGDWTLEASVASGALIRSFAGGVLVNDVVFQTPIAGQVDRATAAAAATGNPLGIVRALNSPLAGQCIVVPVAGDLSGFTDVDAAALVIGSRYILSTSPGLIVEESDTVNAAYPAYLTPGSGEVLASVGVASTTGSLAANTSAGIQAVG
jgi:hypothetical protein